MVMSRHTFSNTPKIFTTFDGPAIMGLYILGATDDGERHGVSKDTCVFGTGVVIGIDWGLGNTNALDTNDLANLNAKTEDLGRHTR